MKLTGEKILSNWDEFIGLINKYISGERKQKLISFYEKHKDELMIMPASHIRTYHNSIPGGYIDHVIRVVKSALRINDVWVEFEVDNSTYTIEELVFSAINHDLGKMGDGVEYAHIPSTDKWRIDNLGENYKFNTKIDFMKVPDRSLYLLSQAGIEMSQNEWIAIQTHDGLYDEGNTAYLKGFTNSTRPRTALLFILHQADMLSARVEWERECLGDFKDNTPKKEQPKSFTKEDIKVKAVQKQTKALHSVKSESLKNMLNDL